MRKSYMRTKLSLFTSIVLIVLGSFTKTQAQGQYNTTNWKFSNPKQFGFTVFDVDFYDNDNVLAVGSDGGIAKSTDGGTNWTYGPFTYVNAAGLRTKTSLLDVHFITANVAYAVGSAGCMAKTTDAGLTWSFIQTPLFANSKNINAVWFTDVNTGYIGGEFNTLDSIPKLYFTHNGGNTWDSINAPIGGKTVVGYINNPNLPPLAWDIDAKGKEIWRIEFADANTGYITGGGSSLFPRFPSAVAATCLPTGTTTTTGSNNAALVWKFKNGTLTDYSLSKERLGYTGINTATITCTTTYGSITPQSQQYRALGIINDSTIVLMSFNNNTVVKVKTGVNDSTLNVNLPGVYEKGKYEMLNFPFPPNGATPIPPTQVLLASNPYRIKKAANGNLYAGANFGALWTSTDTGRTWFRQNSLPQGQNYSNNATWALDIAPNGKFLSLGTNGVVADSVPGTNWKSIYKTIPLSASHTDSRFADCNNGILAGGSSITVTEDGGATWLDKNRPDFAASFYSINGIAYPRTDRAYFAVSNGIMYFSGDKGTTLDPMYNNPNFQMNEVEAIGDTIWVVGYSQFSVAAASRTSNVFRSINAGNTWQVIGGFPVGSTAPNLNKMAFPSRQVGYLAGNRNAIYKTTDGGLTWTSINPFPALNEAPAGYPSAFITYQEIIALDDNTVFAIGNMFTNTGVKRVYKTTNGGTTWTDITGNIPALLPVGNLIGITMHDANNGYVTAGSALFKTTDGGANWTMDLAPVNSLFETMAFAPHKVPAGIAFQNRKLFVTGIAAPTANAAIMEYGNPLDINVNSTEAITNASCTNTSGGSIVVTATGGLAPYTYSINGGTFQSANTFSGLTQGNYTVAVKDAFCGTLSKTITVGYNDNLTVTAGPADTLVCAGAPVPLRASSNNAAATFSWLPTTGLSNAGIANPTATTNSNVTYTVTAKLNGCTKTATAGIRIKPNPVVNAGADKTIVDGASVMLDGSATGTTTSVAWTPAATLTNANTFTPIAQPNTTTTYTMTVVNSDGCTSTDQAVVNVIPYCVKIMNAFTPNGDGVNDRWVVTAGGACTNQVLVKVFNRYGSEVYSSNNYNNDWDGTYKGKPVPDGTYYYVISFRLISGRVVPAKGDVTILR